MRRLFLALLVAAAWQPAFPAAPDIESHTAGMWSLPPDGKAQRWLVIHNLAEAKGSGIYHVEVLRRPAGAPVWQVERIARHMAVTEAALRRSVVKSLNRGAVYPEAFHEALARWRVENGGRGGLFGVGGGVSGAVGGSRA